MPNDGKAAWWAAGLRMPSVGVGGPFAHRDSAALSVPVAQAMAPRPIPGQPLNPACSRI